MMNPAQRQPAENPRSTNLSANTERRPILQRIVCVWIPDWPIQRLVSEQVQLKEAPIFIFGRPKRQKRQVLFCNDLASDAGIRIGMPVVEVPKSYSGYQLEHAPQADRRSLEQLLPPLQKFTPLVGLDSTDATRENTDSIFLDISRTASLLGGPEQIQSQLHDHFGQLGLRIITSVAENLAAAWAISHYGWAELNRHRVKKHSTEKHPSRHPPKLSPTQLPVESLQIDDRSISLLHELGVETVKQVLDLPRASLPSRFGDQMNRRINQFLGLTEETLVVFHPETQLQWSHRLEHPSGDEEVLQTIACLLLRQAVNKLKPQQLGVLSLRCLFQSEHSTMEFQIKLVEPTLDALYLMELLALQIQRREIKQPQSKVQLFIPLVSQHRPRQQWLFEDQRQDTRQQRAGLVERLAARLGDVAVQQLRQQSQALPERNYVARKKMTLQRPIQKSQSRKKPSSRNPKASGQSPHASEDLGSPTASRKQTPLAGSLERPSRLYSPPRPLKRIGDDRCYVSGSNHSLPQQQRSRGAWVPAEFQLGKQKYQVAEAIGPERIESQWWEGRWVRRDYFRVQTSSGNRFWIFRQAVDQRWFIHGDFA